MSQTPAKPARPGPGHAAEKGEASGSNFIRQAIENDLARGKFSGRHWAGHPGGAAV